jgi:hypothetical protein
MTFLGAYAFEYRWFILSGLMFVWVFCRFKDHFFTKRLAFKIFPFFVAIAMLVFILNSPITISSPLNHTLVHPGDKVVLKIELTPRFLSNLYPWVGLSLYSCYTCSDAPRGVSTEGALTGSPYIFTVNVPTSQPEGEIFVDAYAAVRMGDHPAIRSKGVGLVVK